MSGFGLGTVKTNKLIISIGNVSNPTLAFSDDTNTGIYSEGLDKLNISSGGIKKLSVTTSGIEVNSDTDSTSITNGCAIFSGGIGIGKRMYIGETINYSTEIGTKIIFASGGSSANDYKIAIESTSTVYNVHPIARHVFRTGNTEKVEINANGMTLASGVSLIVNNTTDSSSSTTGSIVTTGGIGISKKLFIAGTLNSTNTTSSTSNSSGSLLLSGGIGINNTTDASNSTNGGSITTAGGLAVAKSTYIGTTLNIGGDNESSDSSTGTFLIGTTMGKLTGIGGGNIYTDGAVNSTSISLSAQSTNLNMNSQNITNLAEPIESHHATTKNYVDANVNGSWIYQTTLIGNNDASLSYTSLNGTYSTYVFSLSNIKPTENAFLYVKFSTDGGSSYLNSGYQFAGVYAASDKSGGIDHGGNTQSQISLMETTIEDEDEGVSGILYLYTPSATNKTTLIFQGNYASSATLFDMGITTGRNISTTPVDGIQFYFSSGMITSGTIRVYGIINS